jgi:hypothetical protein
MLLEKTKSHFAVRCSSGQGQVVHHHQQNEKGRQAIRPSALFTLPSSDLASCTNRCGDLCKAAADVGAQRCQRCDQDNSDQSCNQAVLDSGCAGLIFADFVQKLFHLRFPFCMRPGL